MQATVRAALLVGLMLAAIVASGLWAASADGDLLSPAPMTAPPQVQAEAAPAATSTPLPRASYDRGPARGQPGR
jgi:hypothetical protein